MSLRFEEKTAGERALILQEKLSLTRSGNLGYRLEAVQGLAECGRTAVDALCEILTDRDPAMQAAAAEAQRQFERRFFFSHRWSNYALRHVNPSSESAKFS